MCSPTHAQSLHLCTIPITNDVFPAPFLSYQLCGYLIIGTAGWALRHQVKAACESVRIKVAQLFVMTVHALDHSGHLHEACPQHWLQPHHCSRLCDRYYRHHWRLWSTWQVRRGHIIIISPHATWLPLPTHAVPMHYTTDLDSCFACLLA